MGRLYLMLCSVGSFSSVTAIATNLPVTQKQKERKTIAIVSRQKKVLADLLWIMYIHQGAEETQSKLLYACYVINIFISSMFTHKVTLEVLFLSSIWYSTSNANHHLSKSSCVDWCSASLTGFSQLIQREAIDRQVTLETLAIYPGWQAAVFILWNKTWSCYCAEMKNLWKQLCQMMLTGMSVN